MSFFLVDLPAYLCCRLRSFLFWRRVQSLGEPGRAGYVVCDAKRPGDLGPPESRGPLYVVWSLSPPWQRRVSSIRPGGKPPTKNRWTFWKKKLSKWKNKISAGIDIRRRQILESTSRSPHWNCKLNTSLFPANTWHWAIVGSMRGQCRRRWFNVSCLLGWWIQPFSSSKSLLYVTFRHKRSLKWHCNMIKTL